MKITNLIEDTANCGAYLHEHGLCFYIETAHHKVLLDTGASDAFLANAQKKGIDLTAVDTVIISHGHYDHAGGVLAFAALNPTAKIYIHKNAVGAFYNFKNGQTKYIGMDPAITALDQVIFLDGDCTLDGELFIFSGISDKTLLPRGNAVLQKKHGNTFTEDPFDHEQYLVVTEGETRVLLSGCAHNGIVNIMEAFFTRCGCDPTAVISGFHTVMPCYAAEDDAIITQTAHTLAKRNTVYYTGHCTGEYAIALMQPILGDKLHILHSGGEIF